MSRGKAHGRDREYQVLCRDVLTCQEKEVVPLDEQGIDVPFDIGDTTWTFDVALRRPNGDLLVAECRRQKEAIKQEAVAAFAYKVELLRKTKGVAVAGVFFAKSKHQIGAVRTGQFQKRFSDLLISIGPADCRWTGHKMTITNKPGRDRSSGG